MALIGEDIVSFLTIDADLVRELFYYEGGKLLRKKTAGSHRGDESTAYPYRRKTIAGKQYSEHRLIWAYFNGDTDLEIDHINGDTQDNRIENLRAVSRSMNCRNRRKRSDSGEVTGVNLVKHRDGRRYVATWVEGGKQRLKAFPNTPEGKQAAIECRMSKLDNTYTERHGRAA